MKNNFLMLFFAVFVVACGGKETSLIENNGANNGGSNNGDNNGVNNGVNNGDNNGIGENNVLRKNNFEGQIPTLTSDDPVVQFGYDFYLDLCKKFIECRDTVTIKQRAEGGISTTASCVETLVNADSPLRWKESLDSGRLTYDESKKAACLAGLATISCDDLGSSAPNPKNIPGCADVVVGVGAATDECRSSIDCGSDLICDNCPGECRTFPKLECGDTQCESGEFCSDDSTCVSLLGDGEVCANFSQCASPFACIDGKCKGPKQGEPGDNCTDEFTICSIGYYCDGVCRAYKQLDEDCSNNACERPLFCEANKCVKAKETGSCTNSAECISFNCINGSCLAPEDLCILK